MSTVRPSRTGAIGIVVVAVIGAIVLYFRTQWKGDDVGAAVLLGIVSIAASSLFAIAFFRNRRVEFSPNLIRTTPILGASRDIPVTGVSQIVIAPTITTTFGSDLQIFSVMDVAGQPFARLNLNFWNVEELTAATAQYGDRVVVLTEPMPKKQFIERFPRVLSYGMRHPYRLALWLFIGAVAVIFALATFFENLG